MKYKTAFRLLLQATGVLIICFNVSPLVTSLMALAIQSSRSSGLRPSEYYVSVLAGSLVAMVVGCYLLGGAKWFVNRVIPSNRPYCHECGYELTGLAAGVCPECGTA